LPSGLIHHLEDLHLLGLAFDLGGGELPDLKFRARAIPGRAGGQDLAALDQGGKAGGGVDWVPDNRGLYPLRLTYPDISIPLGKEQTGAAFPVTDFNAWMERHGLSFGDHSRARLREISP